MALGDKYATLAELKQRLSITDTNDDARLTNALNSASRGIENFCGRQFNDAGTVSDRLFYPDDGRLCTVDDFSTTSGLVIQVNGVSWNTQQYELYPINGTVNGVPGFPFEEIHAVRGNVFLPLWPRLANITISARWGWAQVPDPVHDACLIAAEEIFKLRDTPFGIGGYGAFGVIRVRNNPFVARMLADYQRAPVLAA